MSWSMRFLGFSMWVFGEAERCEVVPRHPYKPSWLYGLFVRWHEASERRIYFFYPFLTFFLPAFLLSLFFSIFSLLSYLVSLPSYFSFMLRCPTVRRVWSLPLSSSNGVSSPRNFDKSSATKWKSFTTALICFIVIVSISRECCTVIIMLLVCVLRMCVWY